MYLSQLGYINDSSLVRADPAGGKGSRLILSFSPSTGGGRSMGTSIVSGRDEILSLRSSKYERLNGSGFDNIVPKSWSDTRELLPLAAAYAGWALDDESELEGPDDVAAERKAALCAVVSVGHRHVSSESASKLSDLISRMARRSATIG